MPLNLLYWECTACGKRTPRHPKTLASEMGKCTCGTNQWEARAYDDPVCTREGCGHLSSEHEHGNGPCNWKARPYTHHCICYQFQAGK